ncbi:class I tRNA ligase family protein [Paraburkholderia pallida]|uniref:Methionyl/Leucyl tRNA synthetase domain-containing protein n=1 Tax=Paraburkholderia pallida TaxID=2547399 RepID=A0A4P7D5E6_9BURK|nr:class I tRNA ligase family protein [Paraburkholderia pallida]QBR02130.1 hypothetical protein E1956_34025 [Paraburkholderia pallida]
MKTVIITATPPTPNGDLHIGHLSGPYLNADVFSRYVRLTGVKPLYVSFSDHNQTYVVTTAAKTGEAPQALADRYADSIRETLQLANIQTDTFHNPDARHNEFVRGFFSELFRNGKLKKKTRQTLVNADTGEHVFEAYLKGNCQICFSETAGAICEACGHPNDPSNIDSPRIGLSPETALAQKPMELVYLELESYREQIRNFYAAKKGQWRPHILELVDELLAKPLADYPVTYRSEWGIAAPFPDCQGQVLNVWAEMFPGLINAANLVAERDGNSSDTSSGWNDQSQVIQFLGYDNSFFFAFVHLALAFASEGKYAPPAYIVTNEFYELDNFKFSTSKRHVIWGRDILKDVPADPLRFYLSLSNPEGQKMNFTLNGFKNLTHKRLQAPWRSLISTLSGLLQTQGLQQIALNPSNFDLSPIYREAQSRFQRFYSVEAFSLQRVAEHLSQLVGWCASRAESLSAQTPGAATAELHALVYMVVWILPVVSAPLMPDFSAEIRRRVGLKPVEHWSETSTSDRIDAIGLVSLGTLLDF